MAGEMLPAKVNLNEKFTLFDGVWEPHIVGHYGNYEIRIARAAGEFPWHSHAENDELFFVIEGELCVDFRGGTRTLKAGEMLVVPRGIEHRTRTEIGQAKVLIIDPKNTANTGDPETAFTPKEI